VRGKDCREQSDLLGIDAPTPPMSRTVIPRPANTRFIRMALTKRPETHYILLRHNIRKEVIQCLIVMTCGP
jgi:hypothetical protein